MFIHVAGTCCPWLAGMPTGTTAPNGDSVPNNYPMPYTGSSIVPGAILNFTVTGGVNNVPNPPTTGPDGGVMVSHGPLYGMSGITAPINSLLGVFLGADQPDATPPPPNLDFSIIGTNVNPLHPVLKQVFFIGDGLTSANVQQHFYIPSGAVRLFLGSMDGFQWSNNSGVFEIYTEDNLCDTVWNQKILPAFKLLKQMENDPFLYAPNDVIIQKQIAENLVAEYSGPPFKCHFPALPKSLVP